MREAVGSSEDISATVGKTQRSLATAMQNLKAAVDAAMPDVNVEAPTERLVIGK